jgi:hypothetical protein
LSDRLALTNAIEDAAIPLTRRNALPGAGAN